MGDMENASFPSPCLTAASPILPAADRDLAFVQLQLKFIPVTDLGNLVRDHLDHGRILEVFPFCLRVRMIHPASVFHALEDDRTAREGERLRRVQVGPFDVFEGELRRGHGEGERRNGDVKRAVMEIGKVQAERLKEWNLFFQGAVRIGVRGTRSDLIPLYQNAFQADAHARKYISAGRVWDGKGRFELSARRKVGNRTLFCATV